MARHQALTALATVCLLASASLSPAAAAAQQQPTQPVFYTTPEEHGAAGDGKTNDWAAIKRAVASCPPGAHAPCRVVFANSYLSGPIRLNTSGVTLDVRGTLTMLPKSKYPQPPSPEAYGGFISNSNGDEGCRKVAGGYSVCLSDLRITGGGTITSGNLVDALEWWVCKITGCWRPHLVTLGQVHGVMIDNIVMENAPNHNIELSGCVHSRVDNFHVIAPHDSPNTDGINFYGGWDSSLTNSHISNGDDCVSVVPVGLGNPYCVDNPDTITCQGGNVVVRNVSCIGGHGISIGGVRHGSVRNATFENITATRELTSTQTLYAAGGCRMKSYPNSTGTVSDIIYRDIILDSVWMPIQILANYCPWPCNTPAGKTSVTYKNIQFIRVTGKGFLPHTVGQIQCSPFAPCNNITFTDVGLVGGWSGTSVIKCSNVTGVTFEGSEPSGCTPAS